MHVSRADIAVTVFIPDGAEPFLYAAILSPVISRVKFILYHPYLLVNELGLFPHERDQDIESKPLAV